MKEGESQNPKKAERHDDERTAGRSITSAGKIRVLRVHRSRAANSVAKMAKLQTQSRSTWSGSKTDVADRSREDDLTGRLPFSAQPIHTERA